MWGNPRTAAGLRGGRAGLLAEALAALLLARTAIALLPFRHIAAWLGTPGLENGFAVTAEEFRVAKEVGWAVGAIARRVPWDARCFAQALAATGMLRRRGVEGTVSFGGCQSGSEGFQAHAWVRVGSCLITGGPGHQRFQVFTKFARRRVSAGL